MQYKWFRIYVNNFDSTDTLWSVDEGSIETEKIFCKVILKSPKTVSTGYDLSIREIKVHPRAWISVFGILRELKSNDGRRVAVITGK